MFVAESAKARCLKDELAECKSDYANLEAMEAKYVSQVSSLEDELQSVVTASCAAY